MDARFTPSVLGRRLWVGVLVATLMLLLAAGAAWAGEIPPADRARPVAPAPAGAGAESYRTFLPNVRADKSPNSFELIDRAQERGEINEETALVYNVFATFGDLRLPLRFRGDNSDVIDTLATDEALQRFSSLSETARSTLAPFLVPPVYKGSWYDLRMQAQHAATTPHSGSGAPSPQSVPATPQDLITDRCKEVAQGLLIPLESEHFVVWYPPNDLGYLIWAQQTSQGLEGRVYPTLTGLMNRTPKTDGGLGCNPYDARLDVYIVPTPITGLESAYAAVSPHPDAGCKNAPTFMLVLKHSSSDVSVLAHEFMHMIQFGYNVVGKCLDSHDTNWSLEATAKWAEDAFEEIDPAPDVNREHGYAHSYLETANAKLTITNKAREYGAYLFPFYLTRRLDPDRPQLIADIFAAMEQPGGDNLYKVIDEHIDGGFAQRWPEFALYNLNLPPNNFYEQWDDLTLSWYNWKSKQANLGLVVLHGRPQFAFDLGRNSDSDDYIVDDLAAEHVGIELAWDVRLFAFANTFVGKPDVRVQALGQPSSGDWKGPFDWTPRKWNILCRDQAEQNFDELIIMLTNSHWQSFSFPAQSVGPLRFVGSSLGCARWQGTSQWRAQGESHDNLSTLAWDLTATAQITFALSDMRVTGDDIVFEFKPVAGSVNWSHVIDGHDLQTGQTDHCDRAGVKPLAALDALFTVGETLGGSTLNRQFFGAGVAHLNPAELCPDTIDLGWDNMPWWQTDDFMPWQGNDGGVLHGSVTETVTGADSSHTTTSSWDFAAIGP